MIEEQPKICELMMREELFMLHLRAEHMRL